MTPKKNAKKPARKKARTVAAIGDCPCCAVVQSAASGSLFTSEDGVLVELQAPTQESILTFYPSIGFPTWEAR